MRWFWSRSSRAQEGSNSSREWIDAKFARVPRRTTLTVVRADRLELRDPAGNVLAWTRADRALSSIKDAGGRPLVGFRPGVKQMFSAANIATLAVEGAIFGADGPSRPVGPAAPAAPPLDLHDLTATFIFGQIQPIGDGQEVVGLLPPGRLNDRLVERKLGPSEVVRVRHRSPLVFRRGTGEVAELVDSAGAAVATVQLAGDGQVGVDPRTIDAEDNDLPADWLFAIVLGCLHWGT